MAGMGVASERRQGLSLLNSASQHVGDGDVEMIMVEPCEKQELGNS